MLDIVSCSLGSNDRRYAVCTLVTNKQYACGYYMPGLRISHSRPQRHRLEFLHQGGNFDTFRNRSVENFQVFGTIFNNGDECPFDTEPLAYGARYEDSGVYFYARVQQPYRRPVLNFGDTYMMTGRWDSNTSSVSMMSLYVAFECNGCACNGQIRFRRHHRATTEYSEGQTQVYLSSFRFSGLRTDVMDVPDGLDSALSRIYRGLFPSKVGLDDYMDTIWSLRHEILHFVKIHTSISIRAAIASGNDRNYRTFPGTYLPNGWDYSQPPSGEMLTGLISFVRDMVKHTIFTRDELSDHASAVLDRLNDFSSNLIAYTSDLRKFGDTIREILHLSRSVTSPKSWAKAWLSYRYGDRLAVSDTKELLASIARTLNCRRNISIGRSKTEKEEYLPFSFCPMSISESRTSTVIASNASDNALMSRIYALMRWDAWPTLENTWDMIPLSFLVDWILPVSDILHQVDNYVEKAYVRPKTSYVGIRRVATITPRTIDGYKVIRFEAVYYYRGKYDVLKDIRPFTAKEILPAFSVVHLADSIALGRTFRK